MRLKEVLVFSCLFTFSCTVPTEIEIPKENSTLEAKEREISSEIFPVMILENNEKLIVVNSYIKENIFTVYDIQTMDSLYSFGSIGKSNSEFVNIYSIISDDFIEVMDINRIKYVDIQDTCANVTSIKQLSLMALNTFGKINDSIYYTSDKMENNNKELTITNIKNNTSKYIGERPKWAMEPQQGSFDCCSNNEKGVLALFYNSYPEFKIMDFEGKTIKRVKIKVNRQVDFEENMSTYFLSTICSNTFIYTTWINKTYSYLDSHKDDRMQVNLLVIDWEGNIKANYILPGRQRVFVVKNDAKLYTFSPDNRTVINEYDLPKIN